VHVLGHGRTKKTVMASSGCQTDIRQLQQVLDIRFKL
jgi:hypothetical protein